ncbi:MAG: M36 family metallopeptidase, partial [Deltaproteobacteria bacterium]|nr:M36 family metallopeptidase [Deltaproteobacteria bacterium]
MAREIDVRDFSVNRATPARVTQLRALAANVSANLPGSHQVVIQSFDSQTGNPSAVASQGAPAVSGNYVQRALEHAQAISPALGLTGQAPEFTADPTVHETSSSARAVHLQQRYKGIPIFQATVAVRFAPDGSVNDAAGSSISVSDEIMVTPKLSVQEAVLKAAQHVAEPTADELNTKDQFGQPFTPPRVDITGFTPKIRAAFPNIPESPVVLEPGPFGADIKAHLVWFPHDQSLILGWDTILTMPAHDGQYDTIVDANSGNILYCHQLVQYVAARGNVYRVDGSSARQMTAFPRPINDYSLPTPAVTQGNWRWCHKCQGLYFAGNPGSHCPAGGAHDLAGSGNYFLVQNAPLYPGQPNWRWCHKCQGLYFAGNPGSHCPTGGAHDLAGSGDYSLINQNPLAPGQHGWRWCHKCQGLYFGGNAGPVCPAGGAHDQAGSGDYTLLMAGSGLPAAFPDDWVSANQTVGNCTNAHLSAAGLPATGAVQGGILTFNPGDPVGDDQKVLNIFYYCCYMHDFAYLLGFREVSGDFQQNDFGRGGVQGDPVNARSWPAAVTGTANMSTPVDGSSPVMNMGMVVSTNRHTAFDSTVVFHEFTHGISNRLVGGPMNVSALQAPQSGSMGEGWSDYMACTINNVTVLGNWVLNNPAGIRGFPYNSNFPDHFGKIGTGRYNEVHNVGEIWCATLMEMNRRTERHLAVQLVIDALKLTPANPNFLQARDAILLALANKLAAGQINSNQRDGAWQGIWSAFAKFGMGPQATSNGAQFGGTVADFTLGQDNWRWCHKCQGLYFAGNPGSHCPTGGAHDHTGSGNYDLVMNWPAAPGQNNWRWCHKCQGLYFAGNPGSHCPTGGAHDMVGSGDYKLIFNAWGSCGQDNWRWCHKCQG